MRGCKAGSAGSRCCFFLASLQNAFFSSLLKSSRCSEPFFISHKIFPHSSHIPKTLSPAACYQMAWTLFFSLPSTPNNSLVCESAVVARLCEAFSWRCGSEMRKKGYSHPSHSSPSCRQLSSFAFVLSFRLSRYEEFSFFSTLSACSSLVLPSHSVSPASRRRLFSLCVSVRTNKRELAALPCDDVRRVREDMEMFEFLRIFSRSRLPTHPSSHRQQWTIPDWIRAGLELTDANVISTQIRAEREFSKNSFSLRIPANGVWKIVEIDSLVTNNTIVDINVHVSRSYRYAISVLLIYFSFFSLSSFVCLAYPSEASVCFSMLESAHSSPQERSSSDDETTTIPQKIEKWKWTQREREKLSSVGSGPH